MQKKLLSTFFIFCNALAMEKSDDTRNLILEQYRKLTYEIEALNTLNTIVMQDNRFKQIKVAVQNFLQIKHSQNVEKQKLIELCKPDLEFKRDNERKFESTTPDASPTDFTKPAPPITPRKLSASPVKQTSMHPQNQQPKSPQDAIKISPNSAAYIRNESILIPLKNFPESTIEKYSSFIGIAALNIIHKSQFDDKCIGVPMNNLGYASGKNDITITFEAIDHLFVELSFVVPGKDSFLGDINNLSQFIFHRNNKTLNKMLQDFVKLVHDKLAIGKLTRIEKESESEQDYKVMCETEDGLTQLMIHNVDTPQSVIYGKTTLAHNVITPIIASHNLPEYYKIRLKEIYSPKNL